MKRKSTDTDIKELGSKFDIESREEASYILWNIWKESGRHHADLSACIAALSRDDVLYQALKEAHSRGQYDSVRDWKIEVEDSHSVQSEINHLLEELLPTMNKLVAGDIVLPMWKPSNNLLDQDTISHLIKLKIPCLKGKPNLLLHNLGSFAEDVVLEKRLKNIFMANNHTFLVNTSGSGKTRLLLEGLCENWGFYFTSLVDSSLLGSSDVQNSIRTHVPDSPGFRYILPAPGAANYEEALKTNREIASRVFRRVFLARLLIFNLFAEAMNNFVQKNYNQTHDPRVYMFRWLLLQLQPSFVHPQVWDIFDEMSTKLAKASDSFINSNTNSLLASVRTLCSAVNRTESGSTSSQMSTLDTEQTPLFCVLDEAQHAATQHSSSFRSDQNGAHRPILREIVRAWESQSFGQGVFMIVSGTGISKDVVDQAIASAIMKDSRYRWCSNTGAFDQQDVQRRYLKKYIPGRLLESSAGNRLQDRIWYWLHGRYRFTTGYVSELLLNGFNRPHGLLNAYIEHFTNFNVTDASMFIKQESTESLPVLSQYKLDFSKLRKNNEMLGTIHQLTTHYLMRSYLQPLGKDEAIYVEYGFARFVDAETKTVTIDEPLVLLAATRWLSDQHQSPYKHFAKHIEHHTAKSNGFENYIAFCIDALFSSHRRINQVFSFGDSAPEWTCLKAELVSLYRAGDGNIEEGGVRYFKSHGPSTTLGANAKTAARVSQWLDHGFDAPICFPINSMGPDMIFILRLSDGSLIWVAMQTKFSVGKNGLLAKSSLQHAMKSVTPSNFFLDKDGKHYSSSSHPNLVDDTLRHLTQLPHRRTDAGKYSMLRVIASFPAETNLKRCLDSDPDRDGHPIAALNMSLVKKVTKSHSPTDYLQNFEDRRQTKRKHRGEGSSKARTKKIKLN